MRIPPQEQKSEQTAEHIMCGKKLEHTPSPINLGVTLDRTLSYSTHITKVKAKTAARNNVLRKLANSKWGTHPSTLKTTALALCYSTAEYACPVWEISAHTNKVDPVLNDACRAITGCLQREKQVNVNSHPRPLADGSSALSNLYSTGYHKPQVSV